MEIQQMSESELLLMRVIWQKNGVAMFADIMDALAGQDVHMRNNTALTLLNRLIEKGYLKIGKIGRRNQYKATVAEDAYNAAQTKSFLDKVYEGSVKDLVSTLLSHGLVSEEEQEELRRFWREAQPGE